MPGLGLIKGISEDAAELLEAAGVEMPVDLASQDAVTLYPHLRTASRAMKRPDALPELLEIDQWIRSARELVETISPGALSANTPRLKTDVGVSARVQTAPAHPSSRKAPAPVQTLPPTDAEGTHDMVPAIEVGDDDIDSIPAVSIEDADLFDDDLDDDLIDAATAGGVAKTILPANRANDAKKDAETRAHLEKLRARSEVDMGFGSPQIKEEDDVWKEVDKSAFATFNDYSDGKIAIQPLERNNNSELDDSPKQKVVVPATPEPEQQVSRLVRRGINYPHPVMAFCAALFVLFFRAFMVVMVIGLPITLIQLGDRFHEYWIPTAIVIGIFLLLGIVNLVIISKVRCRVCSCPMFLSQRCFKNKKAHLINGVGYVASLALHLVIFQWFRCMYCGTAIRVRGAAKTTRMEVLDAKALDVHDDDDDDPIRAF